MPRQHPAGSGFRSWLPWLLAGLLALDVFGGQHAVTADPEYLIRTWETEDGLPENSATAMVQTPDGYLWFGTFNGLVRFDGVKFTVFDRSNTPELPANGIVNLHLDRHGRLWVSTYGGLVMREAGGGRWRGFTTSDGWAGNFVRTFAERAGGDLLITTFDGQVLEFAGDRLQPLPAPPGKAGEGYLGVVDEAGHWWVVQPRYVGRWDGRRWVETVSAADRGSEFAMAGPAHRGGFWLVSGNELRCHRHGQEVTRRNLAEAPGGIWSLFEDHRGNVWINTLHHGLCRVTPDGHFRRWHSENGLTYDGGRFVFEDAEKNLWIGSSGGGLTRFKPRRATSFGPESGLIERVVTSVCPNPAGGVLIGTYGKGVFQGQEGSLGRFVRPEWQGDQLYVQSVFTDRSGRVWVGTFGQGLWQLGNQTARRIPDASVGGANVISIFEDSRGRLWLGDGQGVTVCESNRFRVYSERDGLPNGGVRSFAEDTGGVIWVSNLKGVFRLVNGRFAEVRTEGRQALHEIACLLAEPDGTMWLGSLRDGLLRWREDRWSRVDAGAGFPVNAVRGMIRDDAGSLWIASNRGIVRANLQELHRAADGSLTRVRCQVLDQADGLASSDCTSGHQPTCARDGMGRLWFATTRGVVMIDPARFDLNTVPPPVQIEQVVFQAPITDAIRPLAGGATVHQPGDAAAHGQRVVRLSAPFAAPLRLPPGSRQIEIHYTGLSLAAAEKVRFQTRLDGSDDAWEEPHDRRVARFYESPPGDHVFRVRAANPDGVWNETGASLAFTMLPYFWQTLWFRSGTASLLVGLGAFAVWWGTRSRVRRAHERERAAGEIRELAGRLINAQEDERRRLARELHDDFSQRLALLSVEMELQGAAAGQESAASLAGMAARVKELSTEVHRMAYDLHPAKLDQLGLVAAARGYCRELAGQSGLAVVFQPGDVPRDLPADLALCLYRVMQESLQNALRHAGAREARVELGAAPGRVWLVVSDDGRGFDVERARREGRLGLSSMRERVRQVRGELKIESTPGRGTRIEVSTPLEAADPRPK